MFEEFTQEQKEKDETMRMAAKDNFEQLMATDNYLEKYITFRIQKMISETVSSFLEPLDKKVFASEISAFYKRTADEKKKQKQEKPRTLKFLFDEHQHQVFKNLHREVIGDNGIPNLKKRNFQMPGAREVMNNDERKRRRFYSFKHVSALLIHIFTILAA